MRYDTTALDKLVKSRFSSRKEFCKCVGLNESAVSRSFKRSKFSTDQIVAISGALNIPAEKIGVYFFTPEGAKREQK